MQKTIIFMGASWPQSVVNTAQARLTEAALNLNWDSLVVVQQDPDPGYWTDYPDSIRYSKVMLNAFTSALRIRP